MAKRSPMKAKQHAADMRVRKLAASPVDDPVVVRLRSQKRYKDMPRYLKHRLMLPALIQKHGLELGMEYHAERARMLGKH